MARRLFYRLWSAAQATGDRVSDAELLRRFGQSRDSAAFELLLHRHGQAVWTACRRILRTEADAEDAFQATFLVLTRRAGSIRKPCVGPWLHRVAVNAALKLQSNQRKPLQALDENVESRTIVGDPELAALVHAEVAALPERYRLPVILCDLEGQTHAEAAAVLEWPVGSVSGRLSRAHALLRERLTRRGVTATSALTALLVVSSPPAGAIHAALAIARGTLPVADSVSTLVQGVIAAMNSAKLKLAALVAASIGVVALAGVGAALAWPRAPLPAMAQVELPVNAAAPEPPEKPIDGDWLNKRGIGQPAPSAFPDLELVDPKNPKRLETNCPRLFGEETLKIEATDDTYRRLQKARLYQGAQFIVKFMGRVEVGGFMPHELPALISTFDDIRAVTIDLWETDQKELIPRLKELVVLAKFVARFTKNRVEAGTDPPQNLHMAQRHRLEVEGVLWKVLHAKSAGK